MFELIDVSDLDECQCGDYRRDHEGGTGRCRMPNDGCHGFRPCLSFRRVSSIDVSQAREQRRKEEVNMSKIFSGPESKTLWNIVNQARTIKELQGALYYVCCRLQELETKYDYHSHEHLKGIKTDGNYPR